MSTMKKSWNMEKMISGPITYDLMPGKFTRCSSMLIDRLRDFRMICFLFVLSEEFVTEMSFWAKDFSFLSRSSLSFPLFLLIYLALLICLLLIFTPFLAYPEAGFILEVEVLLQCCYFCMWSHFNLYGNIFQCFEMKRN
jgi:hypothetical protein